MKKRLLSILCAIICIATSIALPISASAATNMTLSSTGFNINSGNSKTITVKINGKAQNAKNFTWYNSNKNATSVSLGKITAKKLGTSTITAVYKKNTKIRKTCTVKVYANYTVAPNSAPFHGKFTNYSTTYNNYTKQYYMLRSYLEQIEYAGGGSLTLKAGTYNIPCVLCVPSKTTIKLLNGVTIKKTFVTKTSRLAPAHSLFQFVNPSETNVKHKGYNGAHDIKMLGYGKVYIDINGNVPNTNAGAIVMGHNKNITIDNIYFKNLRYGHFIELDASQNVKITNCSFCNNDALVKLIASGAKGTGGGSVNIDIPDKKTNGFTQPWTSYDCTPNKDITFDKCRFNNVQYGVETHQYTQGKYHDNVVIKNCTFGNITRYAVQMLNWTSPTMINNKITNVGKGIASSSDTSYAVYASGVSKPTISGNTFNTCEMIMRFNPKEEAKYGYAPTDNSISREEYQKIADENYSINNSYAARELIVSSLKDGKIDYNHLYPELRFATK